MAKKTRNKMYAEELTTIKWIYIYDIDSSDLYLFGDGESYEDIRRRLTLVPSSNILKTQYRVDTNNEDVFLIDHLNSIKSPDGERLTSRNIKIHLKLKDMPQQINFYGENISVKNDYDYEPIKPDLGNNVTFFSKSSVSFQHSSALKPSVIGDNAIIGSGVHIPAYEVSIEERSIVASLNDYNSKGLILRSGSYITSGIKIKDTGEFIQAHNFYSTGQDNEIGRNAVIKGDVVLTGNTKIPAYARITGNVPLIFSGLNLESIYLRATNQIDGTIYSSEPKKRD